MNEKENEYREIFLAEALNSFAEVNRLLTQLEKDIKDKNILNAIFRITHTLKGNATGMGYERIAEIAHVLEDFFGLVREGKINLDTDIFTTLFKAVDTLGELIDAIKNPKDVKYRGIKTKLEVLIKSNVQQASTAEVEEVVEEQKEEDLDDELKVNFSDLVQVPVKKLDNLLNLVGELIIERDRMMAIFGGNKSNEFSRLNRISSDLQYSVMDVRLVQVDFLFNKFYRIVRDAAAIEKKKVALKLEGTETEIDRNILQVISDSLIHLIRNAVGHGIETPEERIRLGKPEEGKIVLKAIGETDTVILEIVDDGAGIDLDRVKQKAIKNQLISIEDSSQLSEKEILMLIFEPGFSTMDAVNAISGRGVGMDVVKKALDSIGGTIDVSTMKGEGTRMTLKLPSSMAVKSTLLFELQAQTYAIPLSYTESVISLYKADIHKAAGGLMTVHLNRTVALLFLNDLFSYDADLSNTSLSHSLDQLHPEQKLEVVVVNFNGRMLGLVVDKLLQQKEIVEKPLRKPVDHIQYIGGTTILGNGSVCMVLNVPIIVGTYFTLISSFRNKSVKV